MKGFVRVLGATLLLATAGVSLPAHAQKAHEIKGKIVQLEAMGKHVVVEESRGKKYRQPMSVGKDSKIELASGAGSFEQLHVGDEVVATFQAGATGPEVISLKVTSPAAPSGH